MVKETPWYIAYKEEQKASTPENTTNGGRVKTADLGFFSNITAEKRNTIKNKSFEEAYADGTKRYENAQKNEKLLVQYEQITSNTEKAKLQLFFETVFAQMNPDYKMESSPLNKDKMSKYLAKDFKTVYLFAAKQSGEKAIRWPENQTPTQDMFATIEKVFDISYTPEERQTIADIYL